MHTHSLDISISRLSKIEGHADLDIKIRNGKVKDVNLRVLENKRFYTEAVKGKPALTVPQLVSRICGTCSIAHLTACIEAVEKTLDIKPSKQTILMRKLTMYSLMIRDHALHLYFFVLPDLFGVDSILDLAKTHKELIHEALHVKEAGNNLSKLVAGRSVHAPFEKVGGFDIIPDPKQVPAVIKELKKIRKSIINLAKIFAQCEWKLERNTNFVALVTKDFSFLEGCIRTETGVCLAEKNYYNYLEKVVIPYSQADSFKFEGETFLVGALARINLNQEALHHKTKRDLKKYLKFFPSRNIYHNNLAQAIEILHSIDHSVEILENTKFKKEKNKLPKKTEGEGVGVIEAPRGTLYYHLRIKDSKIEYANLVIPTSQNLVSMRENIRQMVEQNIEKGEKFIKKEAEKIIRAYDPCMSCASHFLKINWL